MESVGVRAMRAAIGVDVRVKKRAGKRYVKVRLKTLCVGYAARKGKMGAEGRKPDRPALCSSASCPWKWLFSHAALEGINPKWLRDSNRIAICPERHMVPGKYRSHTVLDLTKTDGSSR
jgi:hypothetical protein